MALEGSNGAGDLVMVHPLTDDEQLQRQPHGAARCGQYGKIQGTQQPHGRCASDTGR